MQLKITKTITADYTMANYLADLIWNKHPELLPVWKAFEQVDLAGSQSFKEIDENVLKLESLCSLLESCHSKISLGTSRENLAKVATN